MIGSSLCRETWASRTEAASCIFLFFFFFLSIKRGKKISIVNAQFFPISCNTVIMIVILIIVFFCNNMHVFKSVMACELPNDNKYEETSSFVKSISN